MSAIVEPEVAREIVVCDGVRVWVASLDHSGDVLQRLSPLLPADELARAGELRDHAKRQRFIVARGVLRLILGDMAKLSPELITLAYSRDGKPALSGELARSSIHFNLSHCRELALIAVADDRRTGIDVEWTEGTRPFEGIAKRFFSPAEQAALAEVPPEDRRRAFFRIWVRKEAYLKARGEGISEWIHETEFSRLQLTESPANAAVATRDQDRWIVRDVCDVPPGFVASVAIERSGR